MDSRSGGNTVAARVALLGIGAAAILGLAACATGPATASAAVNTPAGQPSPAPPAAHRTSDTLSASAKPVVRPYAAARTQWRHGASQISAVQPKYWAAAAADLKHAEHTGVGNTAGYSAAITELRQLASLPDAQQTPAQNAEYHHDIDALNAFFGTPGLYS